MPMRLASTAVLLLLAGCVEVQVPGEGCQEGETLCLPGAPSSVLVCTTGAWAAQACNEGQLCHEGSCQTLTCVPHSGSCLEGKAVTCSGDGSVWSAPVSCAAGEACNEGACEPVVCDANAVRCGGTAGALERCNASGTAWIAAGACGESTTCVEGTCLARNCAAGDRACGPTTAFECDATGTWKPEPCADGLSCAFGRCLACIENAHCAAGEACEDGACVPSSPQIATTSLPVATLNASYLATIAAEGGLPPYTFALSAGTLPADLELGADGRITGRPAAAGTSRFTVQVTDARQATATRQLNLDVLSDGELRPLTTSLPPADLDYPYSAPLAAAGGVPPYAWQSLQALPAGLTFGASGRIEGTPTARGTFPVTLRVLDTRTPPGYAARDFTIVVRIAPLEIIGGEQQLNLFVTKILTLPLIVPYLPYSANLEARGGLRPHKWTIEAPPQIPFNPISQWGLPPGLSLASDGRISGSVTDTSTATTISIPFTSTSLTGYFFYARVTDSQNPAEKKEAIYFVPTVAF